MTYSKSTGFVPDSGSATSDQQFMAVDYREYDFDLTTTPSGDFTAGTGRFTRVGKVVTMTTTTTLTHANKSLTTTAIGFIPPGFVPAADTRDCYYYFNTAGCNSLARADSSFGTYYIDETATVLLSSTVTPFAVSWLTADP